MYSETGGYKLPLTEASWKKLTAASTALRSKYAVTPKEATNLDPKNWALESYKIAKETVYPTVKRNKALSGSYVSSAQPIAIK